MDADEAYYKEHGEPLFSSHMIDLSEEEVDFNIQTTAKYLKRAQPMKQVSQLLELSTSNGFWSVKVRTCAPSTNLNILVRDLIKNADSVH